MVNVKLNTVIMIARLKIELLLYKTRAKSISATLKTSMISYRPAKVCIVRRAVLRLSELI
jgi:hypothetical protein